MQFARDLDSQTADRFIGMYVNERTLDYGPEGAKPWAVCSIWATKPASSVLKRKWIGSVGRKILAFGS